MESVTQYAAEFESRIGIRSGFFNELIREDDWSFGYAASLVISELLLHTSSGDLDKEIKRVGKFIVEQTLAKHEDGTL